MGFCMYFPPRKEYNAADRDRYSKVLYHYCSYIKGDELQSLFTKQFNRLLSGCLTLLCGLSSPIPSFTWESMHIGAWFRRNLVICAFTRHLADITFCRLTSRLFLNLRSAAYNGPNYIHNQSTAAFPSRDRRDKPRESVQIIGRREIKSINLTTTQFATPSSIERSTYDEFDQRFG